METNIFVNQNITPKVLPLNTEYHTFYPPQSQGIYNLLQDYLAVLYPNVFVAGGFPRYLASRIPTNDIDVYALTEDSALQVEKIFKQI